MKNGRIQLQRCGVRGSADGAARLEGLESRVLMSLTLPPMPTILRNTPAQSVVAADFDGDGLTDLAASRANTLAFFRGRADGTFEPAVQTTLPANVGLLAAGRFDGSGRAGVASIMQVQGAGGADVGLLVRVIPDPTKDIGLDILAIFHYRHRPRMVTCKNLVEAMEKLSF